MSSKDSLYIEKRKYIRYEKHLTITVFQLPDTEKIRSEKIVSINNYKNQDLPRFSAELIDISAGGLSIFCFDKLSTDAVYHSTLVLPSGDEIAINFRIIHSESTKEFADIPAYIYGCCFTDDNPPDLLETLYFDDFLPID